MNIQVIAREMLDALGQGGTIPSIVERNPGFGWEQGYAVAAELLKLRRARGEKAVGRKIGFTNRNIWPEYGATAPIWAHVYDRTVVVAEHHRAVISLKGSARPRLEPEIAFKLKAPLPAGITDPVRILERHRMGGGELRDRRLSLRRLEVPLRRLCRRLRFALAACRGRAAPHTCA